MAAPRRTFTVNSAPGLNVREAPSPTARVLRTLKDGEKVTVDTAADPPQGWKALKGGGFVMAVWLK